LPPHTARLTASANSIPVPSSSDLRVLSVSAFSSLASFFNFQLSAVNLLSLTPFPATLTSPSQIAENTTTLSPAFATLTSRVKHKPFVCHSYRKHPGGGTPSIIIFGRVSSHFSCYSVPNPLRIRTYKKRARNSRRIRTYKTQHLKSFRIRTYKKIGGGVGALPSLLHPLRTRTPLRGAASKPFIQCSASSFSLVRLSTVETVNCGLSASKSSNPAHTCLALHLESKHWYIACHTDGLSKRISASPAVRACSFEVPKVSVSLTNHKRKASKHVQETHGRNCDGDTGVFGGHIPSRAGSDPSGKGSGCAISRKHQERRS